jgi:hypothetical protein
MIKSLFSAIVKEISVQCKKRERTTAKRSPSPLMSDPVISFTAAETCTPFFLLEGSRNCDDDAP